ncbi:MULTISPECIES: ATP-binding cassette domain-containing protein [unclassified Adlercreutzia]|uniref:ATP-binding cassette domain-containing protein n=1 Tax=unclassified Adlercreutzia TaxID=2636013 RepID=UPI0013ED141A|nr:MULTISPECIES: ATP-binding cassette domain-containing protein [unclassified Adlercreutzia]
MQLNLTHISYAYPGTASPAISDVSATFPSGWTGIIGDNGCGKSTLARIAARIIAPDSGTVSPRLYSAYCQQDSTQEPKNLFDLASDWGQDARRARALLRIEDDWFWRYDTLSGGQQKRLQIACALYARPDVLVMDEPTNDLDATTRDTVKKALASFDGIGILISHDRDLLDGLASQSLMCEDACWIMRPGGYSKASDQAASERASAIRGREKAAREARRLKAEAQRRSEEAARQKGKRSKRNLAKNDSDAREKIGLAIFSGKDGVAGKLSSSMSARLAKAEAELSKRAVSKRYDHHIGEFGVAARSISVVHLEAARLSAGEFSIDVPELWILPTDHVVLTGANGTGKSLVVRSIVESVPDIVKVAYVPQDVGPGERERALAQLRDQTQEMKGRILSIVARLNSDPDKLLDGDDLSPGELRKLMLAEQLVANPNLLILDEPTNHLDVGSIEALQEMLTGFPGAFLLVTHDRQLSNAVAQIEWETKQNEGATELRVENW